MLSRPSQRGVTIIEIAITMALLALLLFAVVPSVTSMIANSRVRSSAESVQQGLQRARTEALRRNQEVTFWFVTTNASGNLDDSCALSATARGWVVSLNNPSGLCTASSSDTADPMVIEKSSGSVIGTNVALSAWQSGGAAASTSVTFDGFGRVTTGTAAARIDLDPVGSGSDLRRLRIQLTRGGSLRLCEPLVTDVNDPRICPATP